MLSSPFSTKHEHLTLSGVWDFTAFEVADFSTIFTVLWHVSGKAYTSVVPVASHCQYWSTSVTEVCRMEWLFRIYWKRSNIVTCPVASSVKILCVHACMRVYIYIYIYRHVHSFAISSVTRIFWPRRKMKQNIHFSSQNNLLAIVLSFY
jgi:hypothetical protein